MDQPVIMHPKMYEAIKKHADVNKMTFDEAHDAILLEGFKKMYINKENK